MTFQSSFGSSSRTGRAEGAWSRGGGPLASVALLLIGPDLVVQQVDQAPRDPIDGFKTRKHVPEEVSRPGDPSLIARPRRGAELGEVRHHANAQPYSGLHVGGEHGQRLPGQVTPGTGDGRPQQLSQLVQGVLAHSVLYLAKVEPPPRGAVVTVAATRVATAPNSRCAPRCADGAPRAPK